MVNSSDVAEAEELWELEFTYHANSVFISTSGFFLGVLIIVSGSLELSH